jgi:restriction system protein
MKYAVETPPTPPQFQATPSPPLPGERRFQVDLGILDRLIPSRKARKKAESYRDYAGAQDAFLSAARQIQESNLKQKADYERKVKDWEARKSEFSAKLNQQHEEVEAMRTAYESRSEDGLLEYWSQVLFQSEYPEGFPKSFSLDYIAETQMLVVDYELPDVECLPKVKELKYIAVRNELREVKVSDAWINRTYEDVLYQICLRSIYEVFQSDAVNVVSTIVFNGWVNYVDRSNGKEQNACILSIEVTKAEFLQLNLAQVEPRACFRSLKGVSGSKLASRSAVRPIVQLNKQDKRFVASHDVAYELDDSYNLAAMDWLDFENLIREIFEKEFRTNGGEVKITRASRDGGVDAIAFDPDPIRGGKIVIQAKRYTNTVGVSAVRDLFGTVHNEGATKGILVTTSIYGPDAYEFAKGKPLTLLNGNELLYLLQKHGHKARIDLAEAKRLEIERKESGAS